ncbi:hypothetical protein CAPTEDRAFT_156372 [Capitella teleta]|uniref:ubiquitinyl hydrolase 1 n=1 Tax=Capitella teleta TaxID=283909 RepID=R7UJI4_CAPTE|nr:hypothetical protein CAPTEDRAFT_156372 [Capitella teleta]|eukprot:ELU06273.1 hypothetical protein CAPTEDRAFT_156372 [Capitella teleta]
MVEVINGPPECRYGVIRWMGHPKTEPSKLIAGLEMEEESSAFTDGRFGNERCFTCPSNKAFFVFTHKLKRDSRFDESASFIERRDIVFISFLRLHLRFSAFGAMACPDLEGDIPPPSANDLDRFLGQNKGIQGHHNSCYMDAMLFSMYSFSMVFDSILFRPKRSDDIKDYDKVQKVLRDGIVNPLRSNFFVRADKVLNLRKLLDKCSSVKGLMTEEKDPEEFLKSLLQETLKADPFIKLSSGQECFHYQLFMEKEESIVLPTTQQLLELSFLQSDIKLAKTPPCLILQMPRFGKTFKMYSRIVPSLRLDITDIMLSYPRECTICGRLASHECQACYQHFGDSLDKIAFCANCLKKSHSHSKRTNHSPRPLQIDPDYLQYYESHPDASIAREVLELFAVICIATSHYVTFVKCGKGDDAPWVFFDSMADRMGTKHGYNVPEVQQCHFLPEWLKDEQRKKICQISDDKQLPEQMRRLLCDSYICMYQSPSLVHYQ